MDNKLEKFASKLRKLRRDIDITQSKAAKMLNISTNYYGELERGDKLPSMGLLYRIAECFVINVVEFFDENDIKKESPTKNNSETKKDEVGNPTSIIDSENLEIVYRQLLTLKDEIIATKDDSIESKNQLIIELRNEIKRRSE